jgi:putative nucleotidyltransferase with HDIG domain
MAERILIVDDEKGTHNIITSMLVAANFECREAAGGIEALTMLASGEDFDLMFTDFKLADLDGIGLLEHTANEYPDMPVVIVTGLKDISAAFAAIRKGAYDYVMKPVEREQSLAVVRRALEYRRLKLQTRAYQTNLEALVTARTHQLRQTISTLERSYDITLESLGDALALKDANTAEHSRRVTAFAVGMARAMGLPKDEIVVIARGAFLHDIGKLATPEGILRKPNALTPDEMAIMRDYCFRGYEMLKKIPFVAGAAEIVYSHQEFYDGTGYPRGLKGEQIPLGARLVAVANTLDAITSNQPYRAAQSSRAAREEIQRCSGRQFDPEIVRIFLDMPDSAWGQFRKEIETIR